MPPPWVISCLNISCKAPLQKFLTQIIKREEEDHNNKLPCIVCDGSMYFAEAVAHELELPSIMMRTTSAATLLACYSLPQLQKEGYFLCKTPNSVLNASLGSIAFMNQNELREIAKGLTNSRRPFLWVLRPGSLLPKISMNILEKEA
ncbi:hypothetical protein REPUB_Repub11eG0156100 [Reevesia pubescens]